MNALWKFRIIYWTGALVLLSGIFTSFTGGASTAFMLATMSLPSALWGSWASMEILDKKKPWFYWIYNGLGVLWLSYVGAIAGYWFLFELDPERFPSVLINPMFALFWTGALVFAQITIEHKYYTEELAEIFIEFTSQRKPVSVAVNKILYVESRDTFTLMHMEGLSYTTTRSIKEWSEVLEGFIRTHRSMLVNPTHVVGHTSSHVVLHTGDELPISRTYKERVKSYFAVED